MRCGVSVRVLNLEVRLTRLDDPGSGLESTNHNQRWGGCKGNTHLFENTHNIQ